MLVNEQVNGYNEESHENNGDIVVNNDSSSEKAQGTLDESGSDVEDRARAMGWKSLEEYEGDPEKHISADKFLRRGMEKLPILQKNYNELRSKYAETERKLNEMRDFQAHMSDVQYKRALREIQEQQRKAVEDGDTAAFDLLEKQKEEVSKDFSPKAPEQKKDPFSDLQKQKTLLEWNKKNEWYQKDRTLQVEADIYFKELDMSSPELPLQEKLAYVEQKVREMNPQKFSSRRSETPPSVYSGGARKVDGNKGKSWTDIPQEDRAIAEKWIAKRVMTKEEYVKSYFGESK